MERFLRALSPSLREEIEAALVDQERRNRLQMVVSRYIDDDGNWPDDPATATILAQQFLDQVGLLTSRSYNATGLGPVVAGGIVGGTVALGTAKGSVVAGSKLMASYWKDLAAYSTGLHPMFFRATKKVLDRVTEDTPWAQLAKDLTGPEGPSAFDIVFKQGYVGLLQRELMGTFKRSAWRGARSALHHFSGTVGDAATENPWVENYVRVFSENQGHLAERTVRQIINQSQEQGWTWNVTRKRLQELWSLTPRHAQAVENYRRGLERQERSARSINTLTRRYANRLLNFRLNTMSQTESHTAFNLGREAQWIQAVANGVMPLDTQKMWVTAQDELVCPICAPLDGQIVPLGSTFEGEVNFVVPSAHPNCRCIVVPVSAGVPDLSEVTMVVNQEVAKHLGGSSGKDDHPSGTSQDVHGSGSSGGSGSGDEQRFRPWSPEADKWISGAVGAAMIGAGLLVLRRLPPGVRVRPVNPPTPSAAPSAAVPPPTAPAKSALQQALDDAVRAAERADAVVPTSGPRYPSLLKGELDDIATKMNRGIDPKVGWVDDAVDALKGSSAGVRTGYEAGNLPNSLWRFSEMVSKAPSVGAPLTRGMFKVSDDVFNSYKTGRSFTIAPSSFSTSKAVSGGHAGAGTSRNSVIFHTGPETRGLSVDSWRRGAMTFENEVLVSGRFRITRVEDARNARHVWLEQTGLLDYGTRAAWVAKMISKHLGGPDGTQDHPSGSPQSIHAGGESSEGEFFWDLAARTLSRGEHTSRSELAKETRRLNEKASRPLRDLRNGKITDFSVRKLGVMTEGVGFRIGNENHIKTFANKMLAGEDVFRYRGRRDPIMLLVYNDGAQVLDGKHRLSAAKMAGVKKVPVQVARIRTDTPPPETFRQEWNELRRNLVRYQNAHNELPPKRPKEPFDVRSPYSFEIAFNQWMSTQSALRDEERFLEHGVERGVKPRRFRRS